MPSASVLLWTCDHFNISRSFIYKLIRRFDGSLDSIKPKSKRPHHSPNESKTDEYELIKNYHRLKPNTKFSYTLVKTS